MGIRVDGITPVRRSRTTVVENVEADILCGYLHMKILVC